MYPSFKTKILIPKEPISFLQSNQIDRFDTILTGSSYGNNTLDKKLWKLATLNNTRSVAIIEHWSWYIERFREDKQLILPDQIIVNDRLAYDDAKSGIPANKLKIIGNPHLEFLGKNRNLFKFSGKNLRNSMAISDKSEIVLFLSEMLEEDFGSSKTSPLGYTEFDALNLLQKNLHSNQELYIKPHPC